MISPYIERVVEDILSSHAQDLPDLRNITILLPNYHAAQPLAQALMRSARRPALLLPKMVTLNEWVQSITLSVSIVTDSQRGAMLYQHLRKHPWFSNADIWSMTQELLALFDELTHSLATLPSSADEFAEAIQSVYQARQNNTLQLEARLVFELWYAMQGGAELDNARVYQQRLARLAEQARQPLYVLRASDWSMLEQRFLDEYAKRAPVKVFDLREMEAPQGRPTYFAANSLEQEARAAAMQVRRWLDEGKRDIAIVAQDRVAARRMRALLERAEVLVADETGWTFATLSVSTVLDRWLTALQSDFYHHDLLDLLKSPFIFADMSAVERKSAVYQLEQLLRERGVVSGLDAYLVLIGRESELQEPLVRLRQAAGELAQGSRKTLAEWLAALRSSLGVLAIEAGLQQDEAGQQLLRMLATRQQELEQDGGRYSFREWRRWLAQQLDIETFRDSSIESPVRFTHLAATRWRTFDAVLLLGCDADHLPSVGTTGGFFNDAVRAALNLPTRAFLAQRQHDDLLGLLKLNGVAQVTWQKDKDGEARLLSPFLQMLRDTYPQPTDDAAAEAVLLASLAAEDEHRVELPQAVQPSPCIAPETIPVSVSISAYNALVACPYQFYTRHVLRLNELDEVREAIEKRDYGERVHTILQLFHERFPQVAGQDAAAMEAALRQISTDVFADLLQQDFAARAWLARWYRSLPAYLVWQAENEAEGWHYVRAEEGFALELEGVRLRGRIDRLDRRGDEQRVLDYKTQADQSLRNKLKEAGEDVQLACYAHALQVDEAAFVSIEDGKVKAVKPPHAVAELARLNVARLEDVMRRLRDGAGMPANGIDAACQHCEVRGVCRKGEWQ